MSEEDEHDTHGTDDGSSRGLADLSQRELTDLLRALRAGWLESPPTTLALRQAGIDSPHIPYALRALAACSREAAESLLVVTLAERQHRPPPRLELVWTGPETQSSVARDTGIVVRQLFERAEHDVIIGGFRFDHGQSMFRPLHQRMQQHGLRVDMFVDIEDHARSAEFAIEYARSQIETLLSNNWPFGPPYPSVYYDPRSAMPGPPWVSMHAKCVVIDERWTFITSANFTERGQERNLEVGVCIEDRSFASQLAAQWRGLVSRGLVAMY
jgi:phosphatidylserine/phosphatidylglycerophosphate/cardiolipin synthase-like enzyme